MRLNKFLQPLLALSLLIAVVAAFLAVTAVPLAATYRNNVTAIAEARDLYARLARLAAANAPYLEQIAEIQGQFDQQALYITGGTDALAAADLQDRVKAAVQGEQGTLRSVQVLPAQDEDAFRRIGIRAQLLVTTAALGRILYQLETSEPMLFVDNLDIQNRPVRVANGETAPDAVLVVSLDIIGYLQPGDI